ncbi:MAG: NADH-quinone oxidoreductase subunit C [Candidatus Scalindua sp. AMX11]|nr:MAG: NADH-quinone oxidoreductase subunit C [Candidatus Scalindua sp.]NOG82748.1 NADH-quinone oxidoreductase subunit C [Planctomycetota bacterium]RZV95317.1 MAG: NADH-quinone oxidoreductase subunit C [Candidatus Scalindua sp. SCAELEC01]TDE66200.1 MAG: NADH-quinone oxidoreductase subunit C [Candidatus Scalindua sp. AMX11]GJQ57820.1 MAG: NADH-quinone oxidoreductase subunit C [Candidatus Scalindua sp.]
MSEDSFTIENRLRIRFPKAVLKVKSFKGEQTIYIDKDSIVAVSQFLRDDEGLDFDFLTDLCGVDTTSLDKGNSYEIVYHLYSIKKNHRVRLKVKISTSNPVVESVTGIWKTADWHEREAYDMFGITFEGHPNLVRILTPDGFEGHPLRKDYPLKGRQPNSLRDVYRKEGR